MNAYAVGLQRYVDYAAIILFCGSKVASGSGGA